MRLVGGATDSEGTVEVCSDKLWGLVGETGWNLADAQVVCRQLGFPIDGNGVKTIHEYKKDKMTVHSSSFKAAQELTKSKYGKPRKPVHWSNVHCNGDEHQISLCEHHAFSPLDYKKYLLGLIDVAGVKCLLTTTETPTSMNETMGTSAGPSEQTSPVFKAPTYLTMLTPTSPSFPLREYICTATACLLAY